MVEEIMANHYQEPLPLSNHRKGRPASRVSATLTITEAAELLGVGRNLAYEIATRDGELAGVPVIRVGRRLLIPSARLLAVLGLNGNSDPSVARDTMVKADSGTPQRKQTRSAETGSRD